MREARRLGQSRAVWWFGRLAVAAMVGGQLAGSLAGVGDGLTWLWGNPMPHGNNIYDVAMANGLAVQVGDRGQLYTSADYDLWTPRQTHTSKSLRAVTFLNTRLVVTGEEGTVLYAETESLTNFHLANLGTSDWLEGVAAGLSGVVAVGDNGAVYTSSDGALWTRRPQPFTQWLRGVAYGNRQYVAVGEGGFIARSSDGASWDIRSSPTTEDLNRVVWIDPTYFAVGNAGRVLASRDNGATWRSVGPARLTNDLYAVSGYKSLLNGYLLVAGQQELWLADLAAANWSSQINSALDYPAPAWTYYTALWDGSLFLAAGRTGMIVEGFRTNAVSPFVWVSRTDPVRLWLWDVTRWSELYVAVGDLGAVLTSTSGADWDLELVPNSATNAVLLGVAGNNGRLVAVGSQGAVITSTNGVVWTAVEPRPTANDLQGLAAVGRGFVAVGGDGTILASDDGLQWYARQSPTHAFLSGLTAYPGGLVAVGQNGTVLTSSDGVDWMARAAGTTNWLYRVRYINGRLFALGEKGTLLTSTDGATWQPQTSGTGNWLTDLASLKGSYYAVGTQGTVLGSVDGARWDNLGTITSKSLYSLVADHHQLVCVGVEGAVLRGQAGALVIQDFQFSSPAGAQTVTNSFLLSGVPGMTVALESNTNLNGVATWQSRVGGLIGDNDGLYVQLEVVTNAPRNRFHRGQGTVP